MLRGLAARRVGGGREGGWRPTQQARRGKLGRPGPRRSAQRRPPNETSALHSARLDGLQPSASRRRPRPRRRGRRSLGVEVQTSAASSWTSMQKVSRAGLLGGLLLEERRAAARAGLGDRLVPHREVGRRGSGCRSKIFPRRDFFSRISPCLHSTIPVGSAAPAWDRSSDPLALRVAGAPPEAGYGESASACHTRGSRRLAGLSRPRRLHPPPCPHRPAPPCSSRLRLYLHSR